MVVQMNFTPWQDAVYQTIVGNFLAGKLGHAQLFYGQELLGKHEVAEQVAKRLLCLEVDKQNVACGSCQSCLRYMAGTHGDFKSISLTVNDKTGKLRTEITVNQIRVLTEWLSLTSQLGGAQVALILHAHELSRNAANALLKTLEEPFQNRYIFLITDKPYRLPVTIHSRCQRIALRVPEPATALQYLLARGIKPEQATLALTLSDGNPGKAQELLDTDGLALYYQVREDLLACMKNQVGTSDLARHWFADQRLALRLDFAAQIAYGMAKKWALGAESWTPTNVSLRKLQEWIDAINRLRLSLSQPLRHDLSLAGLLYDWRQLLQNSRIGKTYG
jgi:DNA polymerase-3 subunit delta'